MTCKDCLHHRVCVNYDSVGDLLHDRCTEFKCKEQYVELPCKTGDKVYVIVTEFDDNYYTLGRAIEEHEFSFSFYYETTEIMQYEFNVDWFLTEAEAEQALKERE